MDFLTINLALYIVAYLVGSIPFGFVLVKLFVKVDIRELGSANIGATNVLRVVKQKDRALAKKLSVATFALDCLKSYLMLWLAYALGAGESVLWMIAFASLMGHCFSVYLMFEGGKGVSTFFGIFLFFYPLWALLGGIVWFGVFKAFKKSSLSALASSTVLVFGIYFLTEFGVIAQNTLHSLVPLFLCYFILMYRHGDNMMRLLTGKEGSVV